MTDKRPTQGPSDARGESRDSGPVRPRIRMGTHTVNPQDTTRHHVPFQHDLNEAWDNLSPPSACPPTIKKKPHPHRWIKDERSDDWRRIVGEEPDSPPATGSSTESDDSGEQDSFERQADAHDRLLADKDVHQLLREHLEHENFSEETITRTPMHTRKRMYHIALSEMNARAHMSPDQLNYWDVTMQTGAQRMRRAINRTMDEIDRWEDSEQHGTSAARKQMLESFCDVILPSMRMENPAPHHIHTPPLPNFADDVDAAADQLTSRTAGDLPKLLASNRPALPDRPLPKLVPLATRATVKSKFAIDVSQYTVTIPEAPATEACPRSRAISVDYRPAHLPSWIQESGEDVAPGPSGTLRTVPADTLLRSEGTNPSGTPLVTIVPPSFASTLQRFNAQQSKDAAPGFYETLPQSVFPPQPVSPDSTEGPATTITPPALASALQRFDAQRGAARPASGTEANEARAMAGRGIGQLSGR